MSFATLGLSEALLRAVSDQGYDVPTPIQLQAIPAVLEGGDLLAGAQTGTGKTAGFVLPLLQRLSTTPRRADTTDARGRSRRPVRALILAPTRELAAQVEASVKDYGRYLAFSSTAIFGGVGIVPQSARLKKGVDIVVATPGRLLDHVGQGNIDLSRVEILVLDEADRMLDMGFIHDIKRVLAKLPRQRQNLLFSATFSDEIKALADTLLDRPRMIEVAPRNSTVEMIAQKIHPVDRHRKRELLSMLIGQNRWQQVLVFTRTKHGADKLSDALAKDGIRANAIHGNKSQGARTKALADFKNGGIAVLVATDIAARGLDIDQLPHVVNYDLPNVPEDYVHRIGRTGRAGASGEAISLVCVDEHVFLRDIERLIKRPIPRETVVGFEPDPAARAQPVFAPRGTSAPRGDGSRHGAPGRGRAPAPRGSSGAHASDGRRPGGQASHGRSPHHDAGAARSASGSGHGQHARSTGHGGTSSPSRPAAARPASTGKTWSFTPRGSRGR